MEDKRDIDPSETYVFDDLELAELEALRLTRVVEALKEVENPSDETEDDR